MKSLGALLILCATGLAAAELVKKKLPAPPFPVQTRTNLVPGQHALSQPPLNEHALVGQTVYLICVATVAPPISRVLWYEFASTGNGQVISDNGNVLPSHPNNARYRIIQLQPTEFILEISDIRIADGGSYACADIQSGPPEVYSGQAELVVLDSHPNCTSLVPSNGVVLEGQNYTKNCQIYYRGGLTPKVNWIGPEPFFVAEITPPGEVFSGILFTVDRGMDARAFSTVTNFTELTNVPPGLAGNTPNYEYTWQFNQMFVYWPPRNMFAVPMKPTYDVGDEITCHADAFPNATYNWQNMQTLDFVNGPVIVVNSTWMGLNSTLRCQAQNSIQGFTYSEMHFIPCYVPGPTTPTLPPTTPPTTTPLPEGHCSETTGWWLSPDPYAEIYIYVVSESNGQTVGYMRNGSDQHWVEVFGRTRNSDYNFIGLTAIHPYEVGVTGLAAECHRCSGEEVLLTAGIWRSSDDSEYCGDGGTPAPHTSYTFRRVGIGGPGRKIKTPMESPDFKVHKPTDFVSGRLGVKKR